MKRETEYSLIIGDYTLRIGIAHDNSKVLLFHLYWKDGDHVAHKGEVFVEQFEKALADMKGNK